MKIRVCFTETRIGEVTVHVPEGASEKEIHDAAYVEYKRGGAWFVNSKFDVTHWVKK